eukprot:CAMPEP_0116881314 /NCGR_PEP_ID=MMETSP0463-20121206/13443_1 /TAXON_ID=181622 /ORGANISM="Strombidinopsis sp, Strain SopsisLIS2011" /LENGTH=90 /DNA_ID=CAMNT_0004533169 /DNA_START=377 /DNA_END=649 /DNA_ORIENTATION=-
MRLAMDEFSQLVSKSGFWPAMMNTWSNDEANDKFASFLDDYESFIKRFTDGTTFLSGTDQACMLDVNVYPMMSKIVHTSLEETRPFFEKY